MPSVGVGEEVVEPSQPDQHRPAQGIPDVLDDVPDVGEGDAALAFQRLADPREGAVDAASGIFNVLQDAQRLRPALVTGHRQREPQPPHVADELRELLLIVADLPAQELERAHQPVPAKALPHAVTGFADAGKYLFRLAARIEQGVHRRPHRRRALRRVVSERGVERHCTREFAELDAELRRHRQRRTERCRQFGSGEVASANRREQDVRVVGRTQRSRTVGAGRGCRE